MQWAMRWNPFRQCSWPPEDIAIERFRTHVKDHALAILGHDLARTEKFTTSLKDGLDIRETLRNWHTGDLYVKIQPPNRGSLDCVIMLFDSPADPRRYPWRVTWHAEPHDESTLSFFATEFGERTGDAEPECGPEGPPQRFGMGRIVLDQEQVHRPGVRDGSGPLRHARGGSFHCSQ